MTTFKIPQPAPCPICGKDDCIDDEHEDRAQAAKKPLIFESTPTGYAPNAFQKMVLGEPWNEPPLPEGWTLCGHCGVSRERGKAHSCYSEPKPPEPVRGAILDAAKAHTLGDRNDTHGDPIPAMELFMDLVEPILERRKSLPKAAAGALILDAYKRARILHNPYHRDSYEDGCAYTAIAGEAAHRSRTTP